MTAGKASLLFVLALLLCGAALLRPVPAAAAGAPAPGTRPPPRFAVRVGAFESLFIDFSPEKAAESLRRALAARSRAGNTWFRVAAGERGHCDFEVTGTAARLRDAWRVSFLLRSVVDPALQARFELDFPRPGIEGGAARVVDRIVAEARRLVVRLPPEEVVGLAPMSPREEERYLAALRAAPGPGPAADPSPPAHAPATARVPGTALAQGRRSGSPLPGLPEVAPPAASAEAEADLPKLQAASRSGFVAAVRLGYGLPLGMAHGGSKSQRLSGWLSGAAPVGVDAGYEIDQRWLVGAFFQYAYAPVGAPVCGTEAGASCSGSMLRVGLQAAVHLLPGRAFDPWVGLGAGYEQASASRTDAAGVRGTTTLGGFEYAHLQLGLDGRLTPWLSVGPFATCSVGSYTTWNASRTDAKRRYDSTLGESAIGDQRIHGWLQVGLMASFRP